MFDVKPFIPKIVERTPNEKQVHDTAEDYRKNRLTWRTGPNPTFFCRNCNAEYHSVEAAEKSQCLPSWVLWGEKKTNERQHDLEPVAQITNELGDALTLFPYTPRTHAERALIVHKWWMTGRQSPLNRGLLRIERPCYAWAKRYHLYPDHLLFGHHFRRPRTFNERRQVEATEFDELAPKVRAKRRKGALPTHWDDKHYELNRSWKTKKVRKQWMVNRKG